MIALDQLPACIHRGPETEPGWYSCASGALIKGPRGVPGELCFQCPYRNATAPSVARPTCVHLGQQTGFRECASCGGSKTKIKVFACAHPAHRETIWEECQRCPDWSPPALATSDGSGRDWTLGTPPPAPPRSGEGSSGASS